MSKLQWELTRSKILAAQVPANTSSYTAVPHRIFLEELQENLYKNGYLVDTERYLGTKGYQIMTGSITLRKNGVDLPDLRPAVYFTNSYNKAKVAQIRVGAQVLVCKNGMIALTGVSSFQRKHTGTALEDMRKHINGVIPIIEDEFAKLQKNKEEMQQLVLSKDIRAQLVGDLIINEQIITSEQISILRREIVGSTNFKDDSLWSFYNHCTEAFKHSHPTIYQSQHLKLHAYVSDKFGLTGARGLYGNKIESTQLKLELQ